MASNKSAQGPWPSNRLNIDGFYHEDRNRPGSIHASGGYFLEEKIHEFENDLFGINNLEANYMDAQQKKLLEVVYECLENSGTPLEKISGTNVGCYVGNFLADHAIIQSADPEYLHRYTSTGMTPTILANRISHVFNLIGPSLVVDTACSSSIYALHLACQALTHGECESAVVAAANLIQSPEYHIATDKSGVLSATSTCHTFDTAADGYGRADAVNAVYLKRMSAALRDGDQIRAVIRGTAVNANGRTSGISLPKAETQAMVIRAAYARAGLPMDETAYVECHGTGTAVGDPIEVQALSDAFNRSQKPGKKLLVGSVKSNLGHSEAASGLTSILKTVLAFDHGVIPATVGVQSVNPKIRCEDWNIDIVRKNMEWPKEYKHQRISINSFGFGGANAHAILESPQSYLPQYANQSLLSGIIFEQPQRTLLLPLSASTSDSMTKLVSQYAHAIQNSNFEDFLATICNRRTLSHPQRGFIIGQEASLQAHLEKSPLQSASKPSKAPPSIAFVFTGQGAQWPGMGRELLKHYPRFRQTITELDATLQSLPDPPEWHLEDAMLEPAQTSKVHQALYSQPICTAVQIGLVNVLRDWGINPKGIIGHSSGEIAAAYAAGVQTARQAIIVAFYRGKGVSEVKTDGAMLAVQLTLDEALQEIEQSGMTGKVSVACLNSPSSITLSGDRDGIEVILARLKAENKFTRLLNTGGQAYHSHHMRSIGTKYVARLQMMLGETKKPTEGIRFISTRNNQVVDKALGAKYWRDNAENPVLFSPGVKTLLDGHSFHFVEIGPHSALAMPIKQITKDLATQPTDFAYYSALTRNQDDAECLVKLAGQLFLAGHKVDFAAINGFDPELPVGTVASLPAYPWTYHEPLANESRRSREFRHRSHARHDLLGSEEVGGSKRVRTWRNILNVRDVPWLKDHRLGQTVVFPAAGYCVMAIEAADQAQKSNDKQVTSFNLSCVNISNPLVISTEPCDKGVEVFTSLRPSGCSWQFEISSVRAGEPTLHAEGLVEVAYRKTVNSKYDYVASNKASRAVSAEDFYRKLREQGLTFGETFQSLSDIVSSPGAGSNLFSSSKTAIAREQLGLFKGESAYRLHPVTIDALLQSTIGATCQGNLQTLKAFVPTYLGSVRVYAGEQVTPHPQYTIMTKAAAHEFCQLTVEASLLGSNDALIARISDVRLTAFNGGQFEEQATQRCPIQRITWKPDIALNLDDHICKLVEAEKGVQHLLDLLCHKNPNLNILEIDSEESLSDLSASLASKSRLQPYNTFTKARITSTGQLVAAQSLSSTGDVQNTPEDPLEQFAFDFIVIPDSDVSVSFFNYLTLIGTPDSLRTSHFLAAAPPSAHWSLPQQLGHEVSSEFTTSGGRVIMASPKGSTAADPPTLSSIVLVESDADDSAELNDGIADALASHGASIERVTLASLNKFYVPARSTIVSLAELSRPILKTANHEQLNSIQKMISRSSKLLWITGGGVLQGTNPDFALVQGLARTVRLEEPEMELFTMDVSLNNLDVSTFGDQMVNILTQDDRQYPVDYEFVSKDGALFVSRLQSDDARSSLWRQKEGLEEATKPLKDLKYERLTMTSPGRPDSLRFVEELQPEQALTSGTIEIYVQAVGLTSKNLSTLHGKAASPSDLPLTQYTGIVSNTGNEVTGLELGDRVVVLAPSDLRRCLRVPAASCHRLLDSENLRSMSSMPIPFVTALHALRDRIALQSQETILIHWDLDHVSSACVQLAKALGAKVYVIVEHEADKQVVIAGCGIVDLAVSAFTDTDLDQQLEQFSDGKGFDALLTSQAQLLPTGVWAALDSFCRLAVTGDRQSTLTEMSSIMPSNATLTYVNIDQLLQSKSVNHQQKLQRMFSDALDIYRAGDLSLFANEFVVDISDLTTLLAKTCKDEANKSFVLSLENNESQLQVSTLQCTR